MKEEKIECLDKENIGYKIIIKDVKNINLRIGKDEIVNITIPLSTSNEAVCNFVKSKLSWIQNAILKTKKRNERVVLDNLEEIDNKKINVLGDEYIIKVIRGKEEEVQICGDIIKVTTSKIKDLERQKKMLQTWFNKRLAHEINMNLNKYIHSFDKYNISINEIKIKKMKSAWGLCYASKGNISFNKDLIHFPREATEYVVIHEITHLIHANHSKDFYSVVEEILPNYKNAVKMLKE